MAGTDKSRSTYRGLLLMDPRITGVVASGNATYSTSYTQAGEAYDTPVPLALTDDMVLQSSGTPEVAAQTFTVTTQKAGFPGRNKASFRWERATDAAPFGWEHPNVTAGWEAIRWTDGGTYPCNFREPDAVTLSDGTVVVAVSADVSSGNAGVLTYTRDPITGTWSSPITVADAQAPSSHPCLVVLPDDRVIVFFWLEDTFNSVRSINAYVTQDAGATWSLHSEHALSSLSTSTYSWGTRVGRIRACYLNGDIALFAWLESGAGPDHDILQYASADLGGSFTLVSTIADKMYPDCVAVDGTILIGMINQESNQGVTLRRIGSAFQPASTTLTTIDPPSGDDFAAGVGSNVSGDLALWADEDGTVYAAVLEWQGANKQGLLWRSTDAGLTWSNVGVSALGSTFGTFWVTGDSTPSYPTGLAGTHCRGSQVLLHNWVAPVGDEDSSLGVLWLGGYSTVTNPFTGLGKFSGGEVSWSEMWLPYELPSDVDVWTKTATGTESLTSGHLAISTTAQTNYYTASPTSTPEQGLILQWECQCTSGGSVVAEQVHVRATIGDGSHGYKLGVWMSTTAFRVYDVQSSTALGSGAITVDLDGSWIEFRVYVHSPSTGVGAYAVYYRVNSGHGFPRAWTLAISGDDLTDAAGATSTSVTWGQRSSTATSSWRSFFYTAGALTYRISDHAQDGGQDTPDDLNGRDYAPVSISLANGLKIRAVDGPSFLGSEWTIPSRYEYAIEKILPSVEPSPTEGWRATADSATYDIDFELSSLGDTEPLNDSIGLYLQGHNWRAGVLKKYDGGSWSTIASFDLATDAGLDSLTFINNNGGVRAGTAGTEVGNHYFQFNELAGGVLQFGTSAYRRITGNTEGFWTTTGSAVTKQVTIWFEADGTEASSGTNLAIIPPQALIIAHLAGVNFQAYRLEITSGGTPEGYYTLNKLVLGPLVIFGKDSDWDRKYGLEPITTIIENANGNRRSRKMNTPRRSVELPWTDGIDQSQVSGSSAASGADYLKGTTTSGGLAIALRNDTAWQLEGVVQYTGGGHLPVVYCPKITKGTPDTQTHVLRRLSMYGRIVSDWSGEVVVGNEESSEVLRVAGLTIEEEK